MTDSNPQRSHQEQRFGISYELLALISESAEEQNDFSLISFTPAIPWEFAEGNPFSESTGNFMDGVHLTADSVERLGVGVVGEAFQSDARKITEPTDVVV